MSELESPPPPPINQESRGRVQRVEDEDRFDLGGFAYKRYRTDPAHRVQLIDYVDVELALIPHSFITDPISGELDYDVERCLNRRWWERLEEMLLLADEGE